MILAHSRIYYYQDQTAIPFNAISIPGQGGINPRCVLKGVHALIPNQLLSFSKSCDCNHTAQAAHENYHYYYYYFYTDMTE